MDYEEQHHEQQFQQEPQTQEQLIQVLLSNMNGLAQAVETVTNRLDTLAATQQQQAQQQAQNNAQQQAAAAAQQQAAAAAAAVATAAQGQVANAAQQLPHFKMPSIQPPTFSGNVRSKPAHEAQALIDDYIHRAETMAALHKFRGDNEPETYRGQPTYVQWVSISLTGLASSYWRRVPLAQRQQMTWAEYRQWIQTNFTSQLTLQEAIDAMDAIKQKGPATQYTEMFNELVEAIRSANVEYQQEHLCVKYRKGLKDHLRSKASLFRISDNLDALQREAERLDDFYWRIMKNSNKSNNNKTGFRQPFRGPQQPPKDDPMDLDNAQFRLKRLTDQEKVTYRANGWCTFCRSHDHTWAQCTAPGKQARPSNSNGQFQQPKSLNHMEAQTDSDEENDNHEDHTDE